MQLKIKKEMRKAVIYIDLETTNFCLTENKLLDQFGEPIVSLEKMYDGHPVSINKKIRSNFKVRVKFDGTNDIQKAVEAANLFIEEIKELVVTIMEDFVFEKQLISEEFGSKLDSQSTSHEGHSEDIIKDFYHPYYPRS